MNNKPLGVLLLAFGGPDSPEAIAPFMKNLMGGRVPPPALVDKVKARYDLIGGSSPLPGITAQQAAKLEKYLQTKGCNCRVEVGMCHWRPFIKEGVDNLLADGVDSLVAVSLAPFYSQVSTGAYLQELEKALAAIKAPKPNLVTAKPLCSSSVFVEAVSEKVQEALLKLSQEQAKVVRVIFSAHSLPVSYIENGDPYVEQFESTVKQVVERLQLEHFYLAYQSKGGGQGVWLGPMVEDIMDEIKKDGSSEVLVVPVGFVSDHIETLYDIDIAQKNHADAIGLKFHRTASLNTSDIFIRALADVVLE